MAALPFLVVHGGLIAKLAVVVPALLGAGSIAMFRRLADRRVASVLLRARMNRVISPTEGDCSLRGIYRVKDGERWLEHGEDRIDLEGELSVIRGSRVRWPRRATAPVHAHTIADGDDVIVSGVLSRRADQAA